MGARYLKVEEAAIRSRYPTASRPDMLNLLPDRTWSQIGVHRTTQAKGNSIREGMKEVSGSWSDEENNKFDLAYPGLARETLLSLFHPHTWLALQSHAEKRGLHRTREAAGREISEGKKNARKREKR